MLSDYTFLTDHSYSLRPVVDDNDDLAFNKPEEKTKKRQRSSNRINKTKSTTNRTVSIDRSSSDKENNSTSINPSLSATDSLLTTNKNKPIGSRGSRLSARTTMTTSRTPSGKNKTSSKTGIKPIQGSIIKKKKAINRGKTKLLNISQLDSSDVLPSLSIEERVKLRRTKPLQPSAKIVEKKSTKSQDRKPSITKKPTKNTKSFLGSGLDLDNIVLGNRQRRCVQT
jgi:hypothetical protein